MKKSRSICMQYPQTLLFFLCTGVLRHSAGGVGMYMCRWNMLCIGFGYKQSMLSTHCPDYVRIHSPGKYIHKQIHSHRHLITIITFVLVYIVRVLCFCYLCIHITNETYYARTYLHLQNYVSALQCRDKKVMFVGITCIYCTIFSFVASFRFLYF